MQLTIEKLIYGGDGLARMSPVAGEARSKTVFIPYVLPQEQVEAQIVEDRPGFARARLERVLQESSLRTQPPCPYFGECGGCQYQHMEYAEQLRVKSGILRETIRRTAKIDLPCEIQTHASLPLQYRNRTRFHVHAAQEFSIGYFRHGSHRLLPVRDCPISSPLINRALAWLWEAGPRGGVPGNIGEIELFANAADDGLMIELYARAGNVDRNALAAFARDFAAAMPELHGASWFAAYGPRARGTVPEADLLFGESDMRYEIGNESYRVSSGAFFQVNRYLAQQMVDLAVAERSGRVALDLYSGVGLFALPLSRRFERVVAVESSPASAQDLRASAPANVKVSAQSAEAYLTSAAGSLRPDLIVVDPPRAGLGKQVCDLVGAMPARELVYVSCDPSTLARDLQQLTAAGWKICAMHLLDLFPQTFHIESCTVFRREDAHAR